MGRTACPVSKAGSVQPWRADSCVGMTQQVAELSKEASLPVTSVVEVVCSCNMHNVVAFEETRLKAAGRKARSGLMLIN